MGPGVCSARRNPRPGKHLRLLLRRETVSHSHQRNFCMGLRLLGPLELVVGDRSYKIGGPRERVIVATLALKANRVTSVGHLVEAIWDDDPPPSARTQIQVCISGIRKLFRDAGQVGEIKTRSPGYLLEIPTG